MSPERPEMQNAEPSMSVTVPPCESRSDTLSPEKFQGSAVTGGRTLPGNIHYRRR
jgi:hypothetical protein